MNDLLVQSRFRNAILWERMAGRTAAELCREIGCSQTDFGAFLNLKRSPFSADGNYRPVAVMIADWFRMLPEDLFPATLYALTLPDRVERTFESEAVMLSLQCAEARMLPDANTLDDKVEAKELTEQVGDVLETLTEREQRVLMLRFGLDGCGERSLAEVGQMMVGPNSGKPTAPEYVRQIEAKALRKLRHPSRSRKLRGFLEGASREYL